MRDVSHSNNVRLVVVRESWEYTLSYSQTFSLYKTAEAHWLYFRTIISPFNTNNQLVIPHHNRCWHSYFHDRLLLDIIIFHHFLFYPPHLFNAILFHRWKFVVNAVVSKNATKLMLPTEIKQTAKPAMWSTTFIVWLYSKCCWSVKWNWNSCKLSSR